jgi:hypothetical protein
MHITESAGEMIMGISAKRGTSIPGTRQGKENEKQNGGERGRNINETTRTGGAYKR